MLERLLRPPWRHTPSTNGRHRRRPQPERRVLIVEDDLWIRSVLVELLAAEGYSVLEAGNGAEGVRLARRHTPDLIVLDLALPWMGGMAALEHLRSNQATATIPVIVVSGDGDAMAHLRLSHDEQHSTEAIVEKPVDVGFLLEQVQHSLAQAHPRSDAA